MIDGNTGASPAPVRSKDARAVELMARFGRRLELLGMRQLGDSRALVDDVLGPVAVQPREGRVSSDDVASLVLTTARAVVREHRRARRGVLGDGTHRQPGIDPERLRRAIETLAEAERTILLLTCYGQRSADEIAEVIALSPADIRRLRQSALASLRGCIEQRPALRSSADPLPPFGDLVDYWLGELDENRARALEDRLFADDVVAAELDRLARLQAAIDEHPLPRSFVGVTAPILDALEDQGLALRTYRLEPGHTVPGTIGDEPFVVIRLRAALEGIAMVDLETKVGDAPSTFRRGMLVDASASELVLLDSSRALSEVPRCTLSYRVWSQEAVPRCLGEFCLDCSPEAGC